MQGSSLGKGTKVGSSSISAICKAPDKEKTLEKVYSAEQLLLSIIQATTPAPEQRFLRSLSQTNQLFGFKVKSGQGRRHKLQRVCMAQIIRYMMYQQYNAVYDK